MPVGIPILRPGLPRGFSSDDDDFVEGFMNYYVYLMSNKHKTVLYTGVTNDLIRRVYEHKNHLEKKSFTARYNIENLVYFEVTENPEAAISREKQIKSWNRKRKEKLIESKNPNWIDLYQSII